MPIHKGWLPREGFIVDPILKLIDATVLNPTVLLPLVLLARFTTKGRDASLLHPTALWRLKGLLGFALVRRLSGLYSDRVINNWTSDKYDWPNEIAVVTGGAGGIGGHIARLLAERGVKVAILDIQPMTFETGPNTHYIKCDLRSTDDIAAAAREIRERLGDPTILVNNAGVARGKKVLEGSDADLRLTFEVNALAHFRTVREFLPTMTARNHGIIVTVASYAALMAVPGMVDYGASKAASVVLHEGLSAELSAAAPRVRTILVCQGHVRTPLFEGYDTGSPFLVPTLEPETVADAVCEQIFSGRSGQVNIPILGSISAYLRTLPYWYAYGSRGRATFMMKNWKGRQVIQDDEKKTAEERKPGDIEESVVMVPQQEG